MKKAIKVQPRPNSRSVPGLLRHHCWICNVFSPVSVVSSLALLLFVLQEAFHCRSASFSTFSIALSWLLTGGMRVCSTSVPICKHSKPLSCCMSAVDITGWDVRCWSRFARGHQHQRIVKDRLTQPKYNLHVLENITMPFKASGFML